MYYSVPVPELIIIITRKSGRSILACDEISYEILK